jgi:hypothetical protein
MTVLCVIDLVAYVPMQFCYLLVVVALGCYFLSQDTCLIIKGILCCELLYLLLDS